jgi:hypothetical protein
MYPATLPTNWQFFIFKEADQAVTDDQIAAYFAGSLSDQELKQLGIYVYRNLPVDPTYITLIDWGVDNGIDYFYKGVIQDLDTKEISTSVQADATPQGNYSFNIPDVKSLLIRALPYSGSILRSKRTIQEKKQKVYSSSYHDCPDNQLHDTFQK